MFSINAGRLGLAAAPARISPPPLPSGVSRCGLRKAPRRSRGSARRRCLRLRLRRAFGRQAGGDVFRALNFLVVPGAFENAVGLFFARGLGAGFCGGAVRLLVLVLVEAAAGTEAHASAPATGKISLTHNLIRPPINVDVVQNANGDQRANHRGPAITEQRQWDARHRH